VLRAVAGTRRTGIGGGAPTEARGRSPAGAETEAHGAEQDAPHTVPIPAQPSSAIAKGTATSERSIIRTITQQRISSEVSQSRTGGATPSSTFLPACLSVRRIEARRIVRSRKLSPDASVTVIRWPANAA